MMQEIERLINSWTFISNRQILHPVYLFCATQSRFYEHIVFAETKVIKELVYGFHVVVFIQVLAEILHCAEFAAWIK